MPGCFLQVSDLTVRFGQSSEPAVNGITFAMEQGESVAVLGESGAGKTTLARAFFRLLPASAHTHGQIKFRGIELIGAGCGLLPGSRGGQLSLIPQDPELAFNPVMRIRDHVEEVLRIHDPLSRRARRQKAYAALSATGLSRAMALAYPHQLSGGQRQRAAIAQALAARPALLIADEPTSALDNVVQSEILKLLKELVRERKVALLFITHDPTLAHDLADRVLVIHRGRLVESCNSNTLFQAPQHAYTVKLVRSIVPLPPQPRDAELRRRGDESTPSETVVEVRGLSKTYSTRGWAFSGGRKTPALHNVSLSLAPGSVLALVGKSGSGKSTLARCLALLEQPDSGEIRLLGQSVVHRSAKDLRSLRRKVQLVWQHSAVALNPRMHAVDIVAEPLRIGSRMSKAQSRDDALEMLAKVGVPGSLASRSPLALSGGQRQRLALARALIVRPSVLILDEAFAGLDLPLQQEIAATLTDLKSRLSLSYLFITHDLRRAACLGDEVAVMHDGNIVERGEPRKLFWKPEHEATRELVNAILMIF